MFLAAYAIPVTFHTVMAVTGGNSIANVTSVTPGGAGVLQAFNVTSLKGVTDSTTATAYSTAQQLVTTAWDTLFGIATLVWAVRLATRQEPRRGLLRPGQGEPARREMIAGVDPVRPSGLAAAAILLALAGFALSSCGGGNNAAIGTHTSTRTAPTITTRTTSTRTTPTETSQAPPTQPSTATQPETVTVTTTQPSPTITQSVPARTVTVTPTETQVLTQTATVAAPPPVTTTIAAATTSGPSPAAAAAAAAAAANKNEEAETSSTQWGWIAFGILAAAVLVGGLVWWLRRRRSGPTDGGSASSVTQ